MQRVDRWLLDSDVYMKMVTVSNIYYQQGSSAGNLNFQSKPNETVISVNLRVLLRPYKELYERAGGTLLPKDIHSPSVKDARYSQTAADSISIQ